MVQVEILRHPTDEDWQRCKLLALSTVKDSPSCGPVSDDWKRKMLRAGHSPIRTLMFTIRMQVPYWVSVHFCRHKLGVEHYVRSQRNDRQSRYDRNTAPQGAMVTHIMDVNAAALIHMAHMRLCGQAARETREAMAAICNAVTQVSPEFFDFLEPKCVAHHGCDEFNSCGLYERYMAYMTDREPREDA